MRFLLFALICFASFTSLGQGNQKTTRILFIFDASQSMFGRFDGQPKIDVAQKLLAEAVDSLANVPNVQMALRVYGNRSSINTNEQDCNDTHLEVPFDDDNAEDIKHVLRKTTPKGTTPIALSLEKTKDDFTPCSNCRNVIVLITDGIEACDGDPCAVSAALRKNNIFLKPFVIGLGVLEDYKKHFYCIGNYYDAKDEDSFRTVLGLVLSEALNNTSVQINLLDVNGKPIETNVNMTLYDHSTGEAKYNFVHTMNYKSLPDTLSIDPSVTYDITVHSIPQVSKKSIKLLPGQHNTIEIETPQGGLEFSVPGGNQQWKGLQIRIFDESSCEYINFQSVDELEKYIVGSYQIEIPTVPPINAEIEIEQSKTNTFKIPQPGVLSVNCMYSGFGSIYRTNDEGKLELIYTLNIENPSESVSMLPGEYTIVFRSKNSNRAFYTVEKDFTIKPGKSIRISL